MSNQKSDPRAALHRRVAKMIKKMQTDPRSLDVAQIEWVNKIAATAAEFEGEGYSPRQCEVVADIYKAYRQKNNAGGTQAKLNNASVIQGSF